MDDKGFPLGKILGDHGAEVIKIERPGGEFVKGKEPFYHDIQNPERGLYRFSSM